MRFRGCGVVSCIQETATEKIEKIEEKVQRWSDIGKRCRTISYETLEICEQTQIQRKSMIDFSSEIQSTLESGFGSSFNETTLRTIKEMTSGDKVRDAMNIATGLTDVATKCIDKSNELNDLMDDAIDELPRFLKNTVIRREIVDDDDDNREDLEVLTREKGHDKDAVAASREVHHKDVADLLKSLNRDIGDVERCIDDIEHLNLSTAILIGIQAFVQLNDKAKRAGCLFDYIERFSNDVYIVTHSFNRKHMSHTNKPFVTVKNFARSMIRIIRSTEIMKLVSTGLSKLLHAIIKLFQATANNVSKLWLSLSFAKDCMEACIRYIQHAKQACAKAIQTATNLIGKSRSVSMNLQAASEFDLKAFRSLVFDGQIKEAIILANNIDDEVVICTTQIMQMVDRVNDSVNKLPKILTAKLDREVAGQFTHRELPCIEDDIDELEYCTRSLEESDILSSARSGTRGFVNVATKSESCLDRLRDLETFANNCEATVLSFVSVWDLESATTKINDLCRIVNIGEYMKSIANQIERLLRAIISYMKACIRKFSHSSILSNLSTIGSNDNGTDTNSLIENLKNTFKLFEFH